MEPRQELPREVQLHIFQYLYDPWRPRWKGVMNELTQVQHHTRYWHISRFMVKDWDLSKPKHFMICLDCGNYYNLPLYGSIAMYCDCP
jgi:hypothetical protein